MIGGYDADDDDDEKYIDNDDNEINNDAAAQTFRQLESAQVRFPFLKRDVLEHVVVVVGGEQAVVALHLVAHGPRMLQRAHPHRLRVEHVERHVAELPLAGVGAAVHLVLLELRRPREYRVE